MKQILIIITIICILIPFVTYGMAIFKTIEFGAECINYFELAADANNVILAEKYLTKGIEYLEVDGKRLDSAVIPVDMLKDGSKIVAYMGKNALPVPTERI